MFKHVLIAILLMTVPVMAAPPDLVINADGSYSVMMEDANGKTQLYAIRTVIDRRGGGTTPIPPPTTPNPPPTTSLSDRVATFTKSIKVDNVSFQASDAQALGLVLSATKKLVTDGKIKESDLKQATEVAISLTGARLGKSGLLEAWATGIVKVEGFTYTTANVTEAVNGLVKAYGIDPNVLQIVTDKSVDDLLAGKTAQEIQDEVGEASEGAFDISFILELIKAILDLLTRLGIL